MSTLQSPRAALAGNIPTYVTPIIGAKTPHTQLSPAIMMDYWHRLLNPALRKLPEPLLTDQLEEVQAAVRDAMHLLKERNFA